MASRGSGWTRFGTEHMPNTRSEAYSNPFSDSFKTNFAELRKAEALLRKIYLLRS